jgi:hypothetical protein
MILLPVHSKNVGHRLVNGFPAGLREPPSTESTLEPPLPGHQPTGQSESTFVDAPYSIHASMKNKIPQTLAHDSTVGWWHTRVTSRVCAVDSEHSKKHIEKAHVVDFSKAA